MYLSTYVFIYFTLLNIGFTLYQYIHCRPHKLGVSNSFVFFRLKCHRNGSSVIVSCHTADIPNDIIFYCKHCCIIYIDL